MDPSCLTFWPWNQKTEIESPNDLANYEIYHEFFEGEERVLVTVPKCLPGFVWTGVRFVTREPDTLGWYPLALCIPTKDPLVHTIFINYGNWNIIPIRFTPEFIEKNGSPLLTFEFPSKVSGKIELLAQRI